MSKHGYLKTHLSLNKLSLIKSNFNIFGFKMQHENFNILYQLTYLVIPLSSCGGQEPWFDLDFPFLRLIQKTCKSCFTQIWDLKYLRGYLTQCHTCSWGYKMLWLVVDSDVHIITTSLSIPPSTHTPLLLERLSICCIMYIQQLLSIRS